MDPKLAAYLETLMNQQQDANASRSVTGDKAGLIEKYLVLNVRKADTALNPLTGDTKEFFTLELEGLSSKAFIGEQSKAVQKAVFEDTHSHIFNKIERLWAGTVTKDMPGGDGLAVAKAITGEGGVIGAKIIFWAKSTQHPKGDLPGPYFFKLPGATDFATDAVSKEKQKAWYVRTFLFADEQVQTALRAVIRRIDQQNAWAPTDTMIGLDKDAIIEDLTDPEETKTK